MKKELRDLPPTPYNIATYRETHVRRGLRLVVSDGRPSDARDDVCSAGTDCPLIRNGLDGWCGTISEARMRWRISQHWYDKEVAVALWRAGLTSLDGVFFHWPEDAIRARTAHMARVARYGR